MRAKAYTDALKARQLAERDAEWRAALKPAGFADAAWACMGPRSPDEVRVFVVEQERIDREWRDGIIAEKDALIAARDAELARLRAVPADVAGLVAELRRFGHLHITPIAVLNAADALEAQAQKLAEKDARIAELDILISTHTANAKARTARLRQLEAQVKAAREALRLIQNRATYPTETWDETVPGLIEVAIGALAKLDGKEHGT